MTSVTTHTDIVNIDPNFQEYVNSTPLTMNTETPPTSDFITDLTSLNGKQMC